MSTGESSRDWAVVADIKTEIPEPRELGRLARLILDGNVISRHVTTRQTHSSYVRDLRRQGVEARGMTVVRDGQTWVYLWHVSKDGEVQQAIQAVKDTWRVRGGGSR